MDEDELDPRIQVELEKLNTATDEINRLEIELDEANTTFRMLLGECTRRLKVHSGKHGSAIVAARPYYEALDAARCTQQACQKAAVGFQRANEIHEAAKETVALAEARFLSQPDWRFDSAWQEMLNHATLKVRDAEKQRAESAAQHGAATARYKEAQDKVHNLEQRLKRNVAKSRPYFEEKARCNDQLAAQKEVVESLQRCVANTKRDYANSLRRLEGISEEIHRKRADLGACPGIREPGVGAELEYRGELDRCDVQSGSSTAYDGQSDCGSEGLVEGAEVSGVEIREAVVSTVEMLGAAGNLGTSTKQTQQESTSHDLTEDFRRAQIGRFRSLEAVGSRRNDYFEEGTHSSNLAEGSKLEEAKIGDSYLLSNPGHSKTDDTNDAKDSKSGVLEIPNAADGTTIVSPKAFETPQPNDSPAERSEQNAAGDFISEHSEEFRKSQRRNTIGEHENDASSLVEGLKLEEPTDSKHKSAVGEGFSESSEGKASGDSKDSTSGDLANAIRKPATEVVGESRPNKGTNKDINKSVDKEVNARVNENVNGGASVAQEEREPEGENVVTETIESADNNLRGEETLRI